MSWYYFSYYEAGFKSGILGDCVITENREFNKDLFIGVPM
jgi:hypothetical protein